MPNAADASGTRDETRERGVLRFERLSLYAAALAAGSAFSILFETPENAAVGASSIFGAGAFAPLFGAALLAILVGSAGRFRFALLVPSAVVYALVVVYGAPPLSFSGWRGLFQEIGGDLYRAANTMYLQPVPYEPTPGLLVVFAPMIMVICAFATSATLYEKTPVISVATLGLTVGIISTISFENGAGPFFFVFVLAALALMLSSGAAFESVGLTRAGLLAGAVVAVIVLLSPKAPLSDEIISPGAIDWTRIGTGGASRLDVQADVGEYLTTGRESELMRVSSTEPLFWRGGTLDYFDGVSWDSTTRPGQDDGVEVDESVETRPVVQSFEVLDTETDLIFGGYQIAGVSSDIRGEATQNADGSWRAGETLSQGDYYRVLSEVPQPTTAQLQNAGTNYPADVDERFLQLPDDTPEEVGETADEIQSEYDTSNPYVASRAVERYLSTDGGFTYNLDVSFRRADWAIEEFLGDGKEGFCTQFATSMALILRDMDVPTRVAYGSTSGDQVEENVYLVRGKNMHTWVEVYFPGVGWYPFDPTPGFAMPQTMQANAPRPTETAVPDTPASENQALQRNEEQQLQEETPEETPQQQRERRATGGGGGSSGGAGWLLLLPGVVALAGVVPLTKRALLARGRPEDQFRDLVGRLGDASFGRGAAISRSPSLTVNERLVLLAGACELDERPFRDFGSEYSNHLYGPVEGASSRGMSRSYRRALREFGTLPVWRRVLGAFNPASLSGRLGRKVGTGRKLAGKKLRSPFGGGAD